MRVEIESLDVFHRLGLVHAVRSASLDVAPGLAVGLIGPNGAGKSTLLAALMGFVPLRRGRVRIDGEPPDALRVRARVGWLGERPAFPRGMAAEDVLGLHHALLGRPRARRREDVQDALRRAGLAGLARRSPAGLSHGLRQRLALACALLADPALLILDEPATGLDPPGIGLLREEIRAARDRGATVVVSSHQLDEVERTCSHVAFMRRGTLGPVLPLAELRSGRRVLRVRVGRAGAGSAALPERARLLPSGDPAVLRIEVESDAAAASAVEALVASGAPVLEVAPEETAIERLFREAVS